MLSSKAPPNMVDSILSESGLVNSVPITGIPNTQQQARMCEFMKIFSTFCIWCLF